MVSWIWILVAVIISAGIGFFFGFNVGYDKGEEEAYYNN